MCSFIKNKVTINFLNLVVGEEMSQAEEKFMEVRRAMENSIIVFYESCKEIGLDNEGFAEDVIAAVDEATGGEVVFDDWYE